MNTKQNAGAKTISGKLLMVPPTSAVIMAMYAGQKFREIIAMRPNPHIVITSHDPIDVTRKYEAARNSV
jgi:hypothetical protein